MEITLKISKIENGQEWRIGTLAFDESHNGTLTIQQEGADAEVLRQAWAEISKMESLPFEFSERVEVNGEKVTKHKAVITRKGEPRYTDAVWGQLESKYKFLVDQKL